MGEMKYSIIRLLARARVPIRIQVGSALQLDERYHSAVRQSVNQSTFTVTLVIAILDIIIASCIFEDFSCTFLLPNLQ